MEHITYLVVCFIFSLSLCISSAKYAKSEVAQNRIIKLAGFFLFLTIFCNRLALVFAEETADWLKLIPDSFCSSSSYLLSLSLLFGKRDTPILHFVWLPTLAGGLVATFYPDFLGDYPSFMHPSTFLGLLHHTMSAVIVILLFLFRYFTITYQKWYYMVGGVVFDLLLGTFLIFVCDYANPFYMCGPALPNTIFTVWVIAPIYFTVYALILWAVEHLRKRTKLPI